MKTNLLHRPLLCLCFFFCFQSFSQNTIQKGPNYSETPTHLQVPQNDTLATLREHIVLQLADEQVNNDQLFFKAYLLTGKLQNRYSNSRVLHIELQDTKGTIVKKQVHKIADGMVTGNLKLPKRIKEGNYTVKAYTKWMKNFSDTPYTQKNIQIGKSVATDLYASNPVTITPEGGTFLQNYKNKIAFQIPPQLVSKDGYLGTITDNLGTTITKVKAYAPGIGIAFIEPEINKNYFLKLEDNTLHPFPESQDQGYLIRINNLESELASIQVIRSEKSQKIPLKLIGTLRGIPYFEKDVVFSKNSVDIKLDKNKIPRGTLELQLLDEDGTPLAKRPIWMEGSALQITMDQVAATPNEMVYKVKVTDPTNTPVKTQVALSITQKEKENTLIHKNTVFENTDLFTSINDDIDTKKSDRNRRFLEDLYVLTSQKNDQNTSSEMMIDKEDLQYPIQKGLEITGYAYDLNNTLLSNTKIQVMLTNEQDVWIEETVTDTDGILRLKNLHVDGKTTLVFRTEGDDTRSRLVKLERIQDRANTANISKTGTAIKKDEKSQETTSFDTDGSVVLDEIALRGDKTKKEENTSVYGVDTPKSRVKYQDYDRPKSIAEMISELPGVQVSGIGDLNANQEISILRSAGGPVLYVIDGVPLLQNNNGVIGGALAAPSRSSLSPLVNMVNSSDVERIELLLGTEASIYGARAAGGVIVVYTRFASEKAISRKKAQYLFQGYEPTLSFDAYQESLSKKERKNATVLYWNPSIETNEDGEAIIRVPITTSTMPLEVKATTIHQNGSIGILHTTLNE
jgi:hypothetical protein